jgi:endonuclease YncB( thermonuclease family)
MRDGKMTTIDPRGKIRSLDINTPELPQPWRGKPDPEYLGPEAAARLQSLAKPGQLSRIVKDSNAKAATVDKHGRQLAYPETLPRPFDQLYRLPYLGRAIAGIDLNKKMIREGYGDIAYRHLSGRTDRARAYDDAREKARAEGLGIWSPEGRAKLDWVGSEKTVQERSDEWFEKQTGHPRPDSRWDKYMTPGSIGLMAAGNVGIFRDLVKSGPGVAQLWNLGVAVGGALDYNERAARTAPKNAYQPRGIRTRYQQDVEALLESLRSRP